MPYCGTSSPVRQRRYPPGLAARYRVGAMEGWKFALPALKRLQGNLSVRPHAPTYPANRQARRLVLGQAARRQEPLPTILLPWMRSALSFWSITIIHPGAASDLMTTSLVSLAA